MGQGQPIRSESSHPSDSAGKTSGARLADRFSWIVDAWPYALVVFIYASMERWSFATLHLGESSYSEPVLAAELLRTLVGTQRGLVGLVPLLCVAVWRGSDLFTRWESADAGRGSRVVVSLLVAWATWAALTFDHNLFYGQSYNLDRLILVTLAALVWWRPAWVIPFTFLFVALEHQFDHPFGRQIFDRKIDEDLLLLFSAFLVGHTITRRREARVFPFLACALLASYYWYPGVVKLARGWVGHGDLYLGGFAAHVNGWLAALPTEQVEGWLRIGALVDWPARILTLGTELGALLFFVHRKVPRVLLAGWLTLHIGIWAFSGVSFLTWITVDLAVLLAFFATKRREPQLFTRRFAVGGALLIVASPIWVRPPPVGWFDTPLIYTYRYEAVDDLGNRGALPEEATPLGEAWCARDFPFLLDEPSLLVRFGKTNDTELAAAIDRLDGDAASLFALEAQMGHVYFDEEQVARLDRFLSTVAAKLNHGDSWRHALSWAAPARTCLSPRSAPEPFLDSDRPIQHIHVHQLTYFFDGERLRLLRRRPVHTVEVQAVEAPATAPAPG